MGIENSKKATEESSSDPVLGVLGGLGPGATVSFMSGIINGTPAERDQDHIEMIVYNDPKVPDRNYSERRDGTDPLPRLLRNARIIEEAGADLLVIASNTTHRYHSQISEEVDVDVPDMISIVGEHIETLDVDKVGVLTTDTAREIGLFDEAFADSETEVVYPPDMERSMDAIYAYKRGDIDESERLTEAIVSNLMDEDVDAILLGCTEFSALQYDQEVPVIDAAQVLAEYCINRIKNSKQSSSSSLNSSEGGSNEY